MLRIEQITARALNRLDGDRYLLASMVFERVKELTNGAKPFVDMDIKKNKYSDIALREIADGHIGLDKIVPNA
jgi:DNA-directed RNA polymerase subunit omega